MNGVGTRKRFHACSMRLVRRGAVFSFKEVYDYLLQDGHMAIYTVPFRGII
jgi:hypothetical protein